MKICVTDVLSPKKCICPFDGMSTSRRIVLLQLTLNQYDLPIVHKFKLFGVHINADLNWNDPINYMISNTNKYMIILYRAGQFGFSNEVLLTLYT